MNVQCVWCGEDIPTKGKTDDEVTHTICISCIHQALQRAGEEEEHNAWMRAFQAVRLSERASGRPVEGDDQQASRVPDAVEA